MRTFDDIFTTLWDHNNHQVCPLRLRDTSFLLFSHPIHPLPPTNSYSHFTDVTFDQKGSEDGSDLMEPSVGIPRCRDGEKIFQLGSSLPCIILLITFIHLPTNTGGVDLIRHHPSTTLIFLLFTIEILFVNEL